MKQNPSVSRLTNPAGIAVLSAFLILGLAATARSQSADIFHVDSGAGGVGENDEKKDLPAPGPVDGQPSRFAGTDIEPYIAARAAVFSMRNRATDPFGLYQDPDMKPVVRNTAASLPEKRQTALPPTPLVDIVRLIRVTTIMPSEKQFLVGMRAFSEGDEFPLVFQDKAMRIKVIEVTSRRILFRDLDKNEDAALETGMLPPGMIAGGTGMRPPGMVAPGEDMPLRLESGAAALPAN